MASAQLDLLSTSSVIPDRSGNSGSEHVTLGSFTPDANALREAALKSRRKKKVVAGEQSSLTPNKQTTEVNPSQPPVPPTADEDSSMHDATMPVADTHNPKDDNLTDTEDGEIPESNQGNEIGGIHPTEGDPKEKTPRPPSDVRARSTSIAGAAEPPKNVRPGLDMTPRDLDEAKHLILDLLGLGVTPEYLVDCGVSPQCLAVCFYELNLRFPLNLDRRQIKLPLFYDLDKHMKNSQRREQIIRQRDRGRELPRPAPPVISTIMDKTELSLDDKAPSPTPPDVGGKPLDESSPPSRLDITEIVDVHLSENVQSSPSKELDIASMEDQKRMELLARKAAMESINKKRAAKSFTLSSNSSGQLDTPQSMEINDVESAVDALLASVRMNSESSNHSGVSSNKECEGRFASGEEQLSDYDSDAMVEDELETRSPSPSDPEVDELMDDTVFVDSQRNISPDPIPPTPLLVRSPKLTLTRVRFDDPDQIRSSSLPAQPAPVAVPVVARRSRPIASDFIDQPPPRPASAFATGPERGALLKRKRSFVDPAVWPKRIVIDLDSSDEEDDQDEAAPGFSSSSSKSNTDRAPSRTASQDQTPANGQDQAAQMLLEKELQIKAMMQRIKMRELQKKKSASGSRTPVTGTITPATATDISKATLPTVEPTSSPITSTVNLTPMETPNSEVPPIIPVVTQGKHRSFLVCSRRIFTFGEVEVPSLVEKGKDSVLSSSLGTTSPKIDKGKGKALEPEGTSQGAFGHAIPALWLTSVSDNVTTSSTAESDNESRPGQSLSSNNEQVPFVLSDIDVLELSRPRLQTYFKAYVSPLAGFTSPNLQRSSPTDYQLSAIFWISSSARQDASRQLCAYEFPSGVCRNKTCKDIHVRDFGASDGVGKSTIVTSLIKEEYVDNVQHVVPEVTIPPEVTPENVTTYIVDSSAAPADRPHLESEIRKAHVICVVYAIDNPNSFDRVPTYWLPYFRSLGVNVPVILVGNKIDLRGGEVSNEDLENEVAPIMEEFKEVETCVECSARIPTNIAGIIFFAQKAVLHPTAPLYDSREHTLKPAAVDALRRIFRLCDTNKDGVLDTHELNEFQIFDKDQDGALRPEELENLFNTSPGNPWAAEDDEGVDGTITLQHWLAKWSMTTLLDHKKTLAYLAYLGYNTGPTTGALKITKPRRAERRKDKVTRNVFLCYVVGAAGAGKTSILNAFRQLAGGGIETSISKDAPKSKGKGIGELGPYNPTEKVLSVVGAVELRGAEKYLVMQEFGSKSEANMLRDAKTMDLADVIIYVHDSSDTNSFSYISGLRRHEVQPDVYCRRLGLQGPYAVSIKNPQIANLFPEIVATAINPLSAIPGGAERASATLARRKIALSIGAMEAVGGQTG
ncbi:unnamed protein product [Rhizoctonia solani]|uniref:Mitochondrial Rho GTPase 1 n=1 Tax=Rhizoctonia solani TaxID=456999 RepID=A0A8H3AII8_9AGAM|nr:unnamed protein product [Rhizoctonia solani]